MKRSQNLREPGEFALGFQMGRIFGRYGGKSEGNSVITFPQQEPVAMDWFFGQVVSYLPPGWTRKDVKPAITAAREDAAAKLWMPWAGYASYSDYLQSSHWRDEVRPAALERAGHKCQLCGSTSPLNVHHNTYEHLGRELPTDLVVLCEKCHTRFHDIGKGDN